MSDCPVYIYVFGKLGGPFKVGYSNSPKNRAAMIRAYCHAEFTDNSGIMWVQIATPDEKTARRVEKSAHSILHSHKIRLHAHHQRSEWFDVGLCEAHAAIRRACKLEGIDVLEYSADIVPSRKIKDKKEPGHRIQIDWPTDAARAIDAWRAAQPGIPNRAAAVRMLLDRALDAALSS